MSRDQHFVAGSNNTGDGRGNNNERSKKSKQNKIPQRGLGIAQLEKQRVEKQRKEAAAADALSDKAIADPIHSPNSIPSPGFRFPYRSPGLNPYRIVYQHQFHNVDRHRLQFQRPPSSSVTSNAASSVISPSSVSEPPSIQTVQSHSSSSPDDDKIVGIKRPYFHLRSRSADEFPSFRDSPMNSTPLHEHNPSEDFSLTRDFLGLGPPAVDSPPPLSSDNDGISLPDQENPESNEAKEQQVFSFFPTEAKDEQTSRNGNGEKVDEIDLNLKL